MSGTFIKVVPTGYPSFFRDVEIHGTTVEKVEAVHPEAAQWEAIEGMIAGGSSRIHNSKTRAGSYVLISDDLTSAGGDPLCVIVKTVVDKNSVMASAYFARANPGELVWSKPKP